MFKVVNKASKANETTDEGFNLKMIYTTFKTKTRIR